MIYSYVFRSYKLPPQVKFANRSLLHPGPPFPCHPPSLTPSLTHFVRLTADLWGATRRGSRKGGGTERERGSGKPCERGFASPFLSVLLSGMRFLRFPPHLSVLTHSLIHFIRPIGWVARRRLLPLDGPTATAVSLSAFPPT